MNTPIGNTMSTKRGRIRIARYRNSSAVRPRLTIRSTSRSDCASHTAAHSAAGDEDHHGDALPQDVGAREARHCARIIRMGLARGQSLWRGGRSRLRDLPRSLNSTGHGCTMSIARSRGGTLPEGSSDEDQFRRIRPVAGFRRGRGRGVGGRRARTAPGPPDRRGERAARWRAPSPPRRAVSRQAPRAAADRRRRPNIAASQIVLAGLGKPGRRRCADAAGSRRHAGRASEHGVGEKAATGGDRSWRCGACSTAAEAAAQVAFGAALRAYRSRPLPHDREALRAQADARPS